MKVTLLTLLLILLEVVFLIIGNINLYKVFEDEDEDKNLLAAFGVLADLILVTVILYYSQYISITIPFL